jgi:hypothetical protein
MARDLLMARDKASRLGAGGAVVLAAINSAVREAGPIPDSQKFHAAVRGAMRERLLTDVGKVSARLSWSD